METREIISSGLIELYASGLATAEQARDVEAWIKQYTEVAAELEEIEAGISAYARAHAIEPDTSVKEKLFARINDQRRTETVFLNTNGKLAAMNVTVSYWKWAAAAAVILLFGSVALNVSTYSKYNIANRDLQQSQKMFADLQQQKKIIDADMHIVQSKYSVPVSLHGLDAAPDAAAKIFWMQNTGEVYIDPSNLPDAPEGKQYQLWGIVDGKPIDGGMILTNNRGDKYRIQKMKSFGKAQAFAVTLETEKGNLLPKGPMYVMGKM